MEFEEKKALEKVEERGISSIDQDYYDEALNEPPQEESLHRGLKARQISMIAVSKFLSSAIQSLIAMSSWEELSGLV